MADIDSVQLQQQYGGRYIAWRDGEVISSAETYDALSDHLDGMSVEWENLSSRTLSRSRAFVSIELSLLPCPPQEPRW